MITYQIAPPIGNVIQVSVTSDLVGDVTYHWYEDGVYLGPTQAPTRAFLLDTSDQIRVEVIDSIDPDFDPIANAPAGYPARRLLFWLRSLAADVDHYRIEQRKGDAGEWELQSTVPAKAGRWSYQWLTNRLDDLTRYAWRIIPVDATGNQGEPLVSGPELIVRTPDAPKFAVAYSSKTQRVTFAAV